MNTIPAPIRSLQPTPGFSPIPLGYASDPAEGRSLYSPQAVGLATFLGAPVAGSIVMAINYRRLGRFGSAVNTLLCGTLATAALIALGFMLPLEKFGYMIALAALLVTTKLARSLQGEAVARHQAAGGKVASQWKAAGIGLSSLAVLFAIIFAIATAMTPSTGPSVTIGQSQVFYSGSSTQADALSLGKALTDDGYLSDKRAVSVLLARNPGGTTVKFVVNEQAGQEDSTLAAFTSITKEIAPSIGGLPITLKLVNPDLKELKSTTVN